MARLRTLRGVLEPNNFRRLIVDDGRYLNGMKVKSFTVWSPSMTIGVAAAGFGVLTYSAAIPTTANAANTSQFAWSAWGLDTVGNVASPFSVIDPDHVIQQDMFIHAIGAQLSYLIVLEEIEMTPPQAVLQLTKAVTID